jgi:hypothetical protein
MNHSATKTGVSSQTNPDRINNLGAKSTNENGDTEIRMYHQQTYG